MCAASIACGADGLIIEVHPDPREAVSDASQTITPDAFAETMERCRKVANALGVTMD
jgi:3-deoxy-7-phosphoheptulonate synthase